MKRLVVCSIAIIASGLLVGCEESPQPQHTGSTSYGYRAAPSASSAPSQYGALPDRSEAGQAESSVRGFPPGHPLHKEDNYSSTMTQHQADEDASSGQHSDSQTGSSNAQSTSLPHSNFNY